VDLLVARLKPPSDTGILVGSYEILCREDGTTVIDFRLLLALLSPTANLGVEAVPPNNLNADWERFQKEVDQTVSYIRPRNLRWSLKKRVTILGRLYLRLLRITWGWFGLGTLDDVV
jgi:hypothetical protein